MSPLAIIVTYFLTFWTIIFLVVPASNDRKKAGDTYPDNPRIWQKFLITALISAVITLAIWGFVRLDVISIRDWADHWDQDQ